MGHERTVLMEEIGLDHLEFEALPKRLSRLNGGDTDVTTVSGKAGGMTSIKKGIIRRTEMGHSSVMKICIAIF